MRLESDIDHFNKWQPIYWYYSFVCTLIRSTGLIVEQKFPSIWHNSIARLARLARLIDMKPQKIYTYLLGHHYERCLDMKSETGASST